MPDQPVYEIYAIKYAHLFRHSPENFIGGDEHDVPMPLDYFVWAIKGRVQKPARKCWVHGGIS